MIQLSVQLEAANLMIQAFKNLKSLLEDCLYHLLKYVVNLLGIDPSNTREMNNLWAALQELRDGLEVIKETCC